jgi:CheY-like chemotaxis protein
MVGMNLAVFACMSTNRSRILVVDDDPEWLAVMTELLKAEGYDVAVAEDGIQALELLPRFEPVAIVTDLQMPAMDGRELLETLRAQRQRAPVIVMSCDCSEASAGDLRGAERVIEKSAPFDELLAVLAEIRPKASRAAGVGRLFTVPAASTLARALVVATIVVTSAALLNRLRPTFLPFV